MPLSLLVLCALVLLLCKLSLTEASMSAYMLEGSSKLHFGKDPSSLKTSFTKRIHKTTIFGEGEIIPIPMGPSLAYLALEFTAHPKFSFTLTEEPYAWRFRYDENMEKVIAQDPEDDEEYAIICDNRDRARLFVTEWFIIDADGLGYGKFSEAGGVLLDVDINLRITTRFGSLSLLTDSQNENIPIYVWDPYESFTTVSLSYGSFTVVNSCSKYTFDPSKLTKHIYLEPLALPPLTPASEV